MLEGRMVVVCLVGLLTLLSQVNASNTTTTTTATGGPSNKQTTLSLIVVAGVLVFMVFVSILASWCRKRPSIEDDEEFAIVSPPVKNSVKDKYGSLAQSSGSINSPVGGLLSRENSGSFPSPRTARASIQTLRDDPATTAMNCKEVVKVRQSDLQMSKRIGTGSYSDVWLGQWEGQKVAIKQFSTSQDRSAMDECAKEITLLAGLKHPNVVRLLATWSEEPNYGLVLPLAERGSLFEVLYREKIRLDIHRSTGVLRGIVEALVYLHDNDVIHRDIKPENILVDEAFVPKLTDFNVSVQREEVARTMQGTITGTCVYMAPELFTAYSHARYSCQTDIYSVAMLMIDLYTYQRPFAGTELLTNEWALGEAIKKGVRPSLPKTFDRTLERLMMRAWNSAPRERPTARQMAAFLDRSGLLPQV